MAEHRSQAAQPLSRKTQHKKLGRLPNNYRIEKRPLLRPAIPSPYSGAQNQKVVYISAKTPFLSAVKRVEKLLHLADKRLVQSATTTAKQGKNQPRGKRKRGNEEDEILNIAETVEQLKRRGKEGKTKDAKNGNAEGGEDVVLRGTGKAIQKCLELGLWFQQREEYAVRLVTASVAAIDDITVDEEAGAESHPAGEEKQSSTADPIETSEHTAAGAKDDGTSEMQVDSEPPSDGPAKLKKDDVKVKKTAKTKDAQISQTDIPESRIRYTSSLEVYVSLR